MFILSISQICQKVCIVQKRDSGRLFAMKYVSRGVLDGKATGLGGVIKEVELLSSLEHPFLVNLWFSFQGKFHYVLVSSCVALYATTFNFQFIYVENFTLVMCKT